MKCILRLLLSPAARRVLQAHLEPARAREALARTWEYYDELSRTLPSEPSLAGKIMVRLAAAAVAFHKALLSTGVSPGQALDMVKALAWNTFQKMVWPRVWLARRTTKHQEALFHKAIAALRAFPFVSPAYHMVDGPVRPMEVAFDVHRCCVADYLSGVGHLDVCRVAFCEQDNLLAKEWGIELERRGTLAGGAERCDFLYKIGRATRAE